MLVLLNAGPLGGQTAEWADDAPNGEFKTLDFDGAKLVYRLDFAEGSATFVGEEPKPAPTKFVPRVAVQATPEPHGGQALPEPPRPPTDEAEAASVAPTPAPEQVL